MQINCSYSFQAARRLRATTDDEYLDKVLLEVKRLWPPFLGGRRIAKKVGIGGGGGGGEIRSNFMVQSREMVPRGTTKLSVILRISGVLNDPNIISRL